ncbi:MAG: UrcA family protein [Phenylobacterium sp.]
MLTKTLLAGALAFGLAAGAQAEPYAGDTVSVRVPLNDLNLNHEPGARMALYRIRKAAGYVCGGDPGSPLLKLSALYRACQQDSIDRAVATLDHPMVTALSERRAGSTMVAHR